tara:strand:- start:2215 stop:2511 length:297 start_codon:yes stop_codon:yes gene_type:complete
MPHNFVLSINMMNMNRLPINQAMKWMAIFQDCAYITRERLMATCICFDDPLVKFATDVFLKLYDPIKPLYIFDTAEECEAKAVSLTSNTMLDARSSNQ